ncbi:MAG: energy transducer TonB [Deltaproteobacteria bacterium]
MRFLRRGGSLFVGVATTAASLVLVAWVNTPPPHPPEQEAVRRGPVTVAPAPRPPPAPHLAQIPEPQAPAARVAAPAPQLEPARIPEYGEQHPVHATGSALDGLGGLQLGLGALPGVAPEASTPGEPDTPARAVRRPAPRYPSAARRRGIEGEVVMRLRLDADGRVVDVVVVSATPEGVFESAAVAAVRRYVFRPAQLDGKPLASTIEQRMVFRLR